MADPVTWPRALPCSSCEDGLARLGPSSLYLCTRWPGRGSGVFTYRCARHGKVSLGTITVAEFNALPRRGPDELERLGHPIDPLVRDLTLGGTLDHVQARQLYAAGFTARDLNALEAQRPPEAPLD